MLKKFVLLIILMFYTLNFAKADNAYAENNTIVKIGTDSNNNLNIQFEKPYTGNYSYYEINKSKTIVILLPKTKQQKFTSSTTHFAIKNISVDSYQNQARIIINLNEITPYEVQINNDTIIIEFPKVKKGNITTQKTTSHKPEKLTKFSQIYADLNNTSCQNDLHCEQLKSILKDYISNIELYNNHYETEKKINKSKECLSKAILVSSTCYEFNTIETAILKLKQLKEQAYIVSNIYPTITPKEQEQIIKDYFNNLSSFFKNLNKTNDTLKIMATQEELINKLLLQTTTEFNIPFITNDNNHQAIVETSRHLNSLYQQHIDDHNLIIKISKHPVSLTQKKHN